MLHRNSSKTRVSVKLIDDLLKFSNIKIQLICSMLLNLILSTAHMGASILLPTLNENIKLSPLHHLTL